MNPVNLSRIRDALLKIQNNIHMTPVMESQMINRITGRKVFFKCEHLQRAGSFKIRGALNNILCKNERSSIKGVVTHSSGNHGQSVALAAQIVGIPAIVVVPRSTPQVKCDAITGYGGTLVLCENSPRSRVETCALLAKEHGYEIIHPYDDYDTIAGQGTLGLEFLNQMPQLDAVLISISGGGLSSGCAIAMKSLKPDIKVFCVEPEGKELGRSLVAEQRLWEGEPKFLDTIAEGIRTERPGMLTFPILCEYVEKDVLTVNDSDMIEGMKLSMKYLKQVIEASAGACVQALVKHNSRIPDTCQNIGVILCGGNMDVDEMLDRYICSLYPPTH